MLYVIAGRFKNELSLVSYQIYPFLWKIASELWFFPKFLSQFNSILFSCAGLRRPTSREEIGQNCCDIRKLDTCRGVQNA